MGRHLMLVALLLAPLASLAQPVRVESVQAPAWLERAGRTVALQPGIALQADDKVVTGGNARVPLRLAEGSAVRLGERAQFMVERVEDRGLFRAALSVVSGAFRYTT